MAKKPQTVASADPSSQDGPDPSPIRDVEPSTPNPAGVPSTYQSRIRIVDAWRYPGSFAGAPDFIDRNWAAYADSTADQPAGPALRIPASSPTGEKLCRTGDYVVRQEVSLTPSLTGDVEIDVWPAAQFERLFLPVHPNPTTIVVDEATIPLASAGSPMPPKPSLTGGNDDPHPPTGGEG